ncbi:MAG: hypothetical protein HQL69_02165 [Magnetococcales bacterium]|nr:hypothetical protein [Magnetococcales bacterium]
MVETRSGNRHHPPSISREIYITNKVAAIFFDDTTDKPIFYAIQPTPVAESRLINPVFSNKIPEIFFNYKS